MTAPFSDIPLPPGSAAPAFRLAASDGTTVELRQALAASDVLLLFYPGNDTPGCDRQLRTAREEFERFASVGIRPFGVNPAAVEAHADYARRLGLPFPLLSDPGLQVARQYHAVRPDRAEIDRTVYLVGRDGVIRFSARGAPGADIVLEGLEEG